MIVVFLILSPLKICLGSKNMTLFFFFNIGPFVSDGLIDFLKFELLFFIFIKLSPSN